MIGGRWVIGPVQRWWIRYDAFEPRTRKQSFREYQDAIDQLFDASRAVRSKWGSRALPATHPRRRQPPNENKRQADANPHVQRSGCGGTQLRPLCARLSVGCRPANERLAAAKSSRSSRPVDWLFEDNQAVFGLLQEGYLVAKCGNVISWDFHNPGGEVV